MRRLLIILVLVAGCGINVDGVWSGRYTYVDPYGYANGGSLKITSEKGDFAGNGKADGVDAGWQAVGQYTPDGKTKAVFTWPGLGPVSAEGEIDILSQHLVGTFKMTAGSANAGSCTVDLTRAP